MTGANIFVSGLTIICNCGIVVSIASIIAGVAVVE